MLQSPDYSLLDLPEISFSIFYPRKEWTPPPSWASDYMVQVEPGVEVGTRFHQHDKSSPNILFFHGNGEVVTGYDRGAPFYLKSGINLFVADYRGYGFSTGSPTFPSMMADAHAIFRKFQEVLSSNGFTGPRFVMGRSMGCHSAVEIAAHYQRELSGLIAESGSASISRWVDLLISKGMAEEATELESLHLEKLRFIPLPTLVIHGELDTMISLARGLEFYETLAMEDKRFETIPGAGHNDIMLVGLEQYFAAVREFVYGTRG